ncbi:MAG: hypothetical protein ACTHQE_01785 [Thermomicrobiales bacterium]
MTTRVYLANARVTNDPPDRADLPVERFFVNGSDVPEVWVETESQAVGEVGRAASFFLTRTLEIGFTRITGTIERKRAK